MGVLPLKARNASTVSERLAKGEWHRSGVEDIAALACRESIR